MCGVKLLNIFSSCYAVEKMADRSSEGYGDTYIADLVLCFLNSLQLWRVCDHAETFPFILLKVLPVENLQNKQTQSQTF